jgi:hypothetical protein
MKVALVNERKSEHFWKSVTPIKQCLPFYERKGDGYVHRVRSGTHHRLLSKDGSLTHSAYHFWCGATGFIYPSGKQNRKKKPARLVSEPSNGRAVCATCEARAIGSGQIGSGKIGENFVKYKPHADFYAAASKGM